MDIFNVDDNRQIIITAGELKKAFDREYEKRFNEIFESAKADIVAQLMATCLTELNLEFGFGKVRLNRFKNGVEGLFITMMNGGIMGQEFTTQNCIELMHDKYDIDLGVIE